MAGVLTRTRGPRMALIRKSPTLRYRTNGTLHSLDVLWSVGERAPAARRHTRHRVAWDVVNASDQATCCAQLVGQPVNTSGRALRVLGVGPYFVERCVDTPLRPNVGGCNSAQQYRVKAGQYHQRDREMSD
jgi:hypothetical protein